MNTNLESSSQTTSKPISSLTVLGARVTWALLGPLACLGITWEIVSRGSGWLTGFDAAFAIVVGLMLLARWVEQRSGSATTLAGDPATPWHFKRYTAFLPPLAAAIWIAANVMGNHVLQ